MKQYTQYQNIDGTFTSPKNNKVYKSLKALIAHLNCKPGTGGFKAVNSTKETCKHCTEDYGIPNIKKHEQHCYLNPINLKECKFCSKPIKNYKSSKGTCSYSCANSFFKVGVNNGNWKNDAYQSTCFLYHEKRCIICNEDKIVAVHHFNEDHADNSSENLIPMCPTHHQYMHSRHKNEILETVEKYINEFKLRLNTCD